MGVWPLRGREFPGLPEDVHGIALRFAAADALACELHPDEELLAAGMAQVRRSEFTAGRHCARGALERLGAGRPVLMQADGAPRWPDGVRGSISHKDCLAVALVGTDGALAGIGADLELACPLPQSVWGTVLTTRELRSMGEAAMLA